MRERETLASESRKTEKSVVKVVGSDLLLQKKPFFFWRSELGVNKKSKNQRRKLEARIRGKARAFPLALARAFPFPLFQNAGSARKSRAPHRKKELAKMPPARRPRVLVSNDDGIDAPGLRSLVAALAATGEADIYVCSPSGTI